MEMLIENGYMERQKTLKETYMKYLDPMKLDYNNDAVWDAVINNEVVDLFQFDSLVALDTIQKIKPRSLIELTQSNSLMRLQQQEDATESPTETFARFKNDIKEAYKEMDDWGVPKKDQIILERVLKPYSFVADTQEAVMSISRIPELTSFTVAEAHKLRKAIGKKSKKVMAETKELFYKKGIENGVSTNTLDYIWNVQVRRQEGYAFSILHCIAYTFIALQELVLYTQYPSIYWNTACLTVNAGSADTEDENEKNKSTNYGKLISK
jgi:DNA polymerase-3 subunit alpha